MNRPIKFRAWRKENKKFEQDERMFYFGLFDTDCGWVSDKGKSHSFDILIDPVMQFTGLKDKNGKEIYEDDIVEFLANWKEVRNKFETEQWMTGVVTYQEFTARYVIKEAWGIDSEMPMEIIGNKYENPELID